jgi:peptide/nickel transport system substrate-binding protein
VELRRAALALLGAVALAAAACSPTTPVVAVKSQVTSTTSVFNPGGTVTVAVPYLPTNFNPSTPQGANSVTQMVMEQVWPQAFVTDPEFEEETTGFIDSAEVVGLSPMTVSYVIDPKATWSDGYPITASDFVYNWLQQLHNAPLLAPAGLLAGYRDIKSITGSNSGKTVTVVFSRPYSDWEGLFANLIPAHIAQRRGWSSAFEGFHPSRVISGGPFIVSSLQPGKRLVLSRNPRYWATPAHLQSIVFLVERSERGSLTGLRHGTVSIAQFPPGSYINGTIAHDNARGAALSVTTTASPVLWQLVFNQNDTLVGNPTMRQALTLITDRNQLVADSVEMDDPALSGTYSRVFAEGQPGSDTETGSLGYNPIEAAALFKSLGYVPDQNGVLRDNGIGRPLTLTIMGPAGDSILSALEQQLQAEWAACGIALIIHNVSMTDLLNDALPEGNYELALAPYLMPVFPTWNAIIYTDPVTSPLLSPTGLDLHGGSRASTTSSPGNGTVTASLWSDTTPEGTEPGAVAVGAVTRDVMGLNDSAVSSEFEDVMAELNTDAQVLLLSKLDGLLTRDLATVPLFQNPVSLVQQSDILNVSESPTSAGPFWDAEDWVIERTNPTGVSVASGSSGS